MAAAPRRGSAMFGRRGSLVAEAVELDPPARKSVRLQDLDAAPPAAAGSRCASSQRRALSCPCLSHYPLSCALSTLTLSYSMFVYGAVTRWPVVGVVLSRAVVAVAAGRSRVVHHHHHAASLL